MANPFLNVFNCVQLQRKLLKLINMLRIESILGHKVLLVQILQ